MSYCIQVWGGTYKTYLYPLQMLQRKAIRCICFLRKYNSKNEENDSVTKCFTELSILNLSNIYKLELSVFMFKYANKTLPQIFTNYFTVNNEVHNYNTRSANLLRVIRYESVLGQNSFYYNATKVWNEFGNKIYAENRNISYKCYKKKIKMHLLKNIT